MQFIRRAMAGLLIDLQLSATGTSASVAVTATQAELFDASGLALVAKSVNVTINTATTGANGLDTGTLAINTWYAVYLINNGTTTAGLVSLSATAPTLPSGYSFTRRIGWIRTDGSANKYPLSFIQRDKVARYKVVGGSNVATLPTLASGAVGAINTPTWVGQPVANFAPTTARIIKVALCNTAATTQMAAPSSAYSDYVGTNPGVVISGIGTLPADIVLEDANVYWASNNSTCKMMAMGWEDAI